MELRWLVRLDEAEVARQVGRVEGVRVESQQSEESVERWRSRCRYPEQGDDLRHERGARETNVSARCSRATVRWLELLPLDLLSQLVLMQLFLRVSLTA